MLSEVERELIAKCRAGGPRFFEPIVKAYEGPGMRLALGMLGNSDEARDAVQDSFVKAWQSLPNFDVRRPFGPWFFQILRNRCRDLLRSRQARFKVEVLDEHLERNPDDPAHRPDRVRERSASAEILWRALEQIAEEHREVLVLKELEGFRYQEIASILGVPDGTVASRLFHARKALREALVNLGWTAADSRAVGATHGI